MSESKILVVDDDPNVLEAVARTLRRAGYVVETTSDVLGLPLRAGQMKPDMVLLDFDLPTLDGGQLAAGLVPLRSLRDCKVVFHSATDPANLMRAVQETGAAGYIVKGLSRQEFLALIRQLLAGHQT